MKRLSHIGGDGRARMVDVSAKATSARAAIASGKISLNAKTLELIRKNEIAKGDVIATAKIAGIQAAKGTAHLIPLCHTIPLSEVKLDIDVSNEGAEVRCVARTVAQTGVEMEALTGVTVALLTIYDMCKAVDKEMTLFNIRLIQKEKRAVAAVYDRRKQNRRRASAFARLRRDK
jgi:cyclic pyranopterin phosphate synthase